MAGRRRKLDQPALDALRTAKRLTDRMRRANDDAIAAWQAAAAAGASARDIEEAVGVPYRTIARAVARRRQGTA